MQKYEIMFILDPTLEDSKPILKKIEDVLSFKLKNKVFIQQKHIGICELAYPIQKHDKGNYFLWIIETSNDNLLEFKTIARINKQILRIFMLNISKEKNYVEYLGLSKTEVKEEDFKKPSYNKWNQKIYKKPVTSESDTNNDNEVSKKQKAQDKIKINKEKEL